MILDKLVDDLNYCREFTQSEIESGYCARSNCDGIMARTYGGLSTQPSPPLSEARNPSSHERQYANFCCPRELPDMIPGKETTADRNNAAWRNARGHRSHLLRAGRMRSVVYAILATLLSTSPLPAE